MSEQDKIVVFLSRVPLFREFKQRQLERLAKVVITHEYAAGDVIVTQDQGGAGLFVIKSGKADVVRESSDGAKTVVNTFGAGDFFGELSLIDEGQRTASVIATEPTQCLGLVRWQFLSELKDDADMAILIMQEIARRFRRALNAF
jgi:CRP/FNR family transcriptional regulator, cyclic AMP receptor protein